MIERGGAWRKGEFGSLESQQRPQPHTNTRVAGSQEGSQGRGNSFKHTTTAHIYSHGKGILIKKAETGSTRMGDRGIDVFVGVCPRLHVLCCVCWSDLRTEHFCCPRTPALSFRTLHVPPNRIGRHGIEPPLSLSFPTDPCLLDRSIFQCGVRARCFSNRRAIPLSHTDAAARRPVDVAGHRRRSCRAFGQMAHPFIEHCHSSFDLAQVRWGAAYWHPCDFPQPNTSGRCASGPGRGLIGGSRQQNTTRESEAVVRTGLYAPAPPSPSVPANVPIGPSHGMARTCGWLAYKEGHRRRLDKSNRSGIWASIIQTMTPRRRGLLSSEGKMDRRARRATSPLSPPHIMFQKQKAFLAIAQLQNPFRASHH